ncbi:MAG: FAD-dependent oxidoreductase [Actinomycetota bacterium]|nr:FAD-dependent oxidoreductase [Actinomycetota bacterium]
MVTPSHPVHYEVAGPLLGQVEEVLPGFESFDELVRATERCLECPDPTCVKGCPTHNDIPGFIRAAHDGDLDRAREILSLTSCLSAACSRVCDWNTQCQGSCSWTLAGGDAVEIGRIERYIADHTTAPAIAPAAANGLNVAVVGSGPGGLGAAYQLRKAGTAVTVFERDSEPGGILRWGIPSYVLPSNAWRPTVEDLEQAGVNFKFNHGIDPDGVNRLLNDFDAVILAAGAAQPTMPRIDGLNLGGVEDATKFLDMAKSLLGSEDFKPTLTGKKVLVLGAGNTAMDVARSVLRLGGTSIAIDWMEERFARGRPDEIADARKEGVDVRFLTTVSKLVGDSSGNVVSAELLSTTHTSADTLPTVNAGSGKLVDVDMVVLAMGYRVEEGWKSLSKSVNIGAMPKKGGYRLIDRRWLGSGFFTGKPSLAALSYDREHLRVESAFPVNNRVWAIGDLRIGPSTVVAAMAQGMSAARGLLSELDKNFWQEAVSEGGDRPTYVGSALIVHDGASETVKEASTYISESLWGSGWEVRTTDIAHLDDLMMLGTDLLVFGSQTQGPGIGGIHPSRKALSQFPTLPPLYGKKVVSFVVHTLSAGNAAREFAEQFSSKGAQVLTTGQIRSKNLSQDAQKFASEVLRTLYK